MNGNIKPESKSRAGNEIPEWIAGLFRVIDAMDTDSFVNYLTDEAVFVYGSGNPVTGKENVKSFLGAFYDNLAAIEHLITGVWETGEVVFVQTKCTYTLRDERKITIPALNLFNMQGELIQDYLIYADPTPLTGPG